MWARIAKLLAAGMLPGTWICDEQTRILRRQVTRRSQLVRGRTRARNQIHAIVIRNLSGRGPTGDLLAKKGREPDLAATGQGRVLHL